MLFYVFLSIKIYNIGYIIYNRLYKFILNDITRIFCNNLYVSADFSIMNIFFKVQFSRKFKKPWVVMVSEFCSLNFTLDRTDEV